MIFHNTEFTIEHGHLLVITGGLMGMKGFHMDLTIEHRH